MRPLTRQSARWAPSTALHSTRQSSLTRCSVAVAPAISHPTTSSPNHRQTRAFHPSIIRTSSSDPRTPPYDPEVGNQHSEPIEGRREEHRTRSKTETDSSPGDTNVSTPHSAKPTSNSPLRNKTLRQRRAAVAGTQAVPSPPPIPDWFLAHNVELVGSEEGNGLEPATTTSATDAQSELKSCVDPATGHTLFTIEVDPESPVVGQPKNTPNVELVKRDGKGILVGEDGKEIPLAEWAQQIGAQIWDETPEGPRKRERVPPRTWVSLDIQLGAHGGMSLENQNRASYAASRVDISLVCPDSEAHGYLDWQMREIAQQMGADLVRIDANDLEELAGEYVGQGHDSPGSFSTVGYDVFEGYSATSVDGQATKRSSQREEEDEDDFDEEDEGIEERPTTFGGFGNISDLRKTLYERRHDLAKALQGTGIAGFSIGVPKNMDIGAGPMSGRGPVKSSSGASDYVSWDDARLMRLLDSLIDAPKQKRENVHKSPSVRSEVLQRPWNPKSTTTGEQDVKDHQKWRTNVGGALLEATQRLDPVSPFEFQSTESNHAGVEGQLAETKPTVIHVRDLKDICRSKLGDTMIRRLVRVVQKRRRTGQKVIVIGTTASSGIEMFANFGSQEKEEFPFRTVTIPPYRHFGVKDRQELIKTAPPGKQLDPPANARILEINLRHMGAMLRRLKPGDNPDLRAKAALEQMNIYGTHFLTETVLRYDQIQRIVLSAIGLAQIYAKSDVVQPIHLALAANIMDKAKKFVRFEQKREEMSSNGFVPLDATNQHTDQLKFEDNDGKDNVAPGQRSKPAAIDIEKIRKSCNSHEGRLLTGVVDAQNIKTGFSDVHAPSETIEALKTLTSLSLLRPDAFKYGVLANDRLPGLLLYGPPGTGKTLLARAVAKESQATVLEVTGAQIYEKYVGEGEKMVRAVFSLAKKLSPCIVFIDEADAIFGSRSGSGGRGERNTHRELINQFLREWDGMDSHSEKDVFIMVATNRPFDLDDAVLRRLPRRLLVDLPTPRDRESILGIHLKGEALDDGVQLGEMAKQTPLYSGSDLKNLCVSAALACVREENELVAAATAAAPPPTAPVVPENSSAPSPSATTHESAPPLQSPQPTYTLPATRTLHPRHFTRALAEISASISEDMASLTAIRKFDEQYGDRQGRRKKKAGLGFGMAAVDEAGAGEVDESAARVRQDADAAGGRGNGGT